MISDPDTVGPAPIIVSFISGKGGVGKTMLSVAFAKEISAKTPTLMVDLDFFNRGLTGLIGQVSLEQGVTPPAFVTGGADAGEPSWGTVEIGRNLYFLTSPELMPADLENFATLDVGVLRGSIRNLILQAAARCGAQCIVLDCHGGPDNASFAACQISLISIMVSEPDKITFFGTLHFMRQLQRHSEGLPLDVRLVFNKVVSAFSGRYLTRVYNRTIRESFGNKPLLAIFPLEIDLTREFERTTFLTQMFPHSQLARRTHLLLYDLLAREHCELLPASVRALPGPVRTFWRWNLHPPAIFKLESVIRIVGVGALLLAALTLFDDYYLTARRQTLAAAAAQLETVRFMEEHPDLLLGLEAKSASLRVLEDLAKTGANTRGFVGYGSSVDEVRNPRVFNLAAQIGRRQASASSPTSYDLVAWIEELRAYRFSDTTKYTTVATDAPRREVLQGSTLELRALTAMPRVRRLTALLIPIAVVWPLGVLLLSWSQDIDRTFTRLAREGRKLASMGRALMAVVLWGAFLGGFALVSVDTNENMLGLSAAAVVVAVAALDQGTKAFCTGWLERRWVEVLLRAVFVGYVVVLGSTLAAATKTTRANTVLPVSAPARTPPPADEVQALAVSATPTKGAFQPGGRPVWFRFRASRGTHTIAANSVGGDTFVRLYLEEGFESLAEDDDGGEALGSRLVLDLEPQSYLIELRNLNERPDDYEISVSGSDP